MLQRTESKLYIHYGVIMPKLTVLQLRQAKEKCRLVDGGGLFFEITSSVLKRWLYRFRVGGKGNMFIIGHYPEMFLEEARSAHRKAKDLVKQGINPSQVRCKKGEENSNREKTLRNEREQTFKYLALEWITQQRGGWNKSHTDWVVQSTNLFLYVVTDAGQRCLLSSFRNRSNEKYTPRNLPDFDLSDVQIQPGNRMKLFTKTGSKGNVSALKEELIA